MYYDSVRLIVERDFGDPWSMNIEKTSIFNPRSLCSVKYKIPMSVNRGEMESMLAQSITLLPNYVDVSKQRI